MKFKMILSALLLAGLFLTTSCGTSGGGNMNADAPQGTMNLTLADVLRKSTGLTVMGMGDNVKILVRGISTFNLETQPLYIIDGVPIGNSYQMANNAVDPQAVTSVRVIRSQSELVQYGTNATNGVIIIKTKNTIDND